MYIHWYIAQDAQKFGPLDSISCFPVKNFLGKLEKIVRKPQNPVQQIVRRIHEKQSGKTEENSLSS